MPKIKTGILCMALLLLAIGIAYFLVQSALPLSARLLKNPRNL